MHFLPYLNQCDYFGAIMKCTNMIVLKIATNENQQLQKMVKIRFFVLHCAKYLPMQKVEARLVVGHVMSLILFVSRSMCTDQGVKVSVSVNKIQWKNGGNG